MDVVGLVPLGLSVRRKLCCAVHVQKLPSLQHPVPYGSFDNSKERIPSIIFSLLSCKDIRVFASLLDEDPELIYTKE